MKRTGEGTLLATTGFELSLQLAKLDPKTFVYGYSRANELVIIEKDGSHAVPDQEGGTPSEV